MNMFRTEVVARRWSGVGSGVHFFFAAAAELPRATAVEVVQNAQLRDRQVFPV